MKKRLHLLPRRARRLVGAALAFSLLALPAAAQCGDDLYVNPGLSYQEYGRAVAVDGDWAVVGLPAHASSSGAADVLRRVDGEWRLHQRLSSTSSGAYARFGSAVGISGTALVVGANEHAPGDPPVYDQGCAIVFELQGDQWLETAYLTASDADSYDYFGSTASIDGDVIAIGAPWDEATGGTGAGSVYMFERTGGVWVEDQKLQPTGVGPQWYFGCSVDVDGLNVIAGAYGAGGTGDNGHAAVFVKIGSNWIQQALWADPFSTVQSYFGCDVAIEGDVAIVGHQKAYAPVSGYRSGIVHVYYRSGAVWSPGPILEPSVLASSLYFGASVDLVDDTTIAVGAMNDGTFAAGGGSAFFFEETGGSWTEVAHVGQCQPSDQDHLGSILAASTDTILVGAYEDDDMGLNCGKVLVVEDLAGTWLATQELWPGSVISLTTGGSASIEMDFGAAQAGRMFFMAGTTSGTTPGITVMGQHIPLNIDVYTLHTVQNPNQAPLTNSFGFTDGSGRATCTFTLPPGLDPALAGLRMTHCAALIFPLDYVSRTDDLLLYD